MKANLPPGRYTGGSNNLVGIQDDSSNLDQAMAEDWAAVTNFIASKSTFAYQVELYYYRLFTKDTENDALQRAILNLKEAKNLKAKISNLKWPSHSVGGGTTFKEKANKDYREPKWKRDGHNHHPT